MYVRILYACVLQIYDAALEDENDNTGGQETILHKPLICCVRNFAAPEHRLELRFTTYHSPLRTDSDQNLLLTLTSTPHSPFP